MTITTNTIDAIKNDAISKTKNWIEKAVIGLNLCPFAKAVYIKNRIRYILSQAENDTDLLQEIIQECRYLEQTPSEIIDTTLIILPLSLLLNNNLSDFNNFNNFNDFLGEAEDELWVQGYNGIFQLASFHPQYQFAETDIDDPQNNTNRSPYPMLHLLREASVDNAVLAFPDAALIYENNIKTMQQLGHDEYQNLLSF